MVCGMEATCRSEKERDAYVEVVFIIFRTYPGPCLKQNRQQPKKRDNFTNECGKY